MKKGKNIKKTKKKYPSPEEFSSHFASIGETLSEQHKLVA